MALWAELDLTAMRSSVAALAFSDDARPSLVVSCADRLLLWRVGATTASGSKSTPNPRLLARQWSCVARSGAVRSTGLLATAFAGALVVAADAHSLRLFAADERTGALAERASRSIDPELHLREESAAPSRCGCVAVRRCGASSGDGAAAPRGATHFAATGTDGGAFRWTIDALRGRVDAISVLPLPPALGGARSRGGAKRKRAADAATPPSPAAHEVVAIAIAPHAKLPGPGSGAGSSAGAKRAGLAVFGLCALGIAVWDCRACALLHVVLGAPTDGVGFCFVPRGLLPQSRTERHGGGLGRGARRSRGHSGRTPPSPPAKSLAACPQCGGAHPLHWSTVLRDSFCRRCIEAVGCAVQSPGGADGGEAPPGGQRRRRRRGSSSGGGGGGAAPPPSAGATGSTSMWRDAESGEWSPCIVASDVDAHGRVQVFTSSAEPVWVHRSDRRLRLAGGARSVLGNSAFVACIHVRNTLAHPRAPPSGIPPAPPSRVCPFMYRYILRESCSQFDSLPLTYLTIPPTRKHAPVSPSPSPPLPRRSPRTAHHAPRRRIAPHRAAPARAERFARSAGAAGGCVWSGGGRRALHARLPTACGHLVQGRAAPVHRDRRARCVRWLGARRGFRGAALRLGCRFKPV
jgi:hypothetical protein